MKLTITKLIATFLLLGSFAACREEKGIVPEPPVPPLRLSQDTVRMMPGAIRKLQLTDGSGTYTLIPPVEAIVKAVIEGEELTIEALAPGSGELQVLDDKTKQKATLGITVLPPPEPVLPASVNVRDGVLLSWPAGDLPESGIVELPSSVTAIGNGVFKETSIREIKLPATLKRIGEDAFAYCNNLVKVSLPEGVTEIGQSAFYQCHALETLILPASIDTMAPNAFASCDKLKEITLTEGLKVLGESAFYGCTALEQVKLPNSLTKLGDNAFNGCIGLLEISLPDNLEVIKNTTFAGCSALIDVKLPAKLKHIGRYAFKNCVFLKKVEFPQAVDTVEAGAFSGCSALTRVVLPVAIKEIQASTFENCSKLTEVVFPEGHKITQIGIKAFASCTGLVRIVLPEGVTEINNMAFQNSTALEEVDLPSTLKSIKLNAFVGCQSLKKVISRATTPPTLTGNVFNRTATTKELQVPAAAKAAYQGANNWNRFTSITQLD